MLKPCANSSVAPFFSELLDLLVEILLRQIGHQHGDQVGVLRPRRPALRPSGRPAWPSSSWRRSCARRPRRCSRCLQVQRMCTALAAVAQDRDAGALERLLVDVFARIQLRHCPLHCSSKHKKNPASARGRCGVFWCIALALVLALQADIPHRLLISRQGKGQRYSTTTSVARFAPLTDMSLMIRACIQCAR